MTTRKQAIVLDIADHFAAMLAGVDIDELRAHIESLPSVFDVCRHCEELIQESPTVHEDGSIHWTGWEHCTTQAMGCGRPFMYATPHG